MKFGTILKNKHFCNLAAIIRVPFLSHHWKKNHPEVPFWKLLDELNDVKTEQMFHSNKDEFVTRFCAFLVTLTTADPRLTYSPEDLNWFIGAMENEYNYVIVNLLFAYFSANDEMLTAPEVAEITDTSESNWRNKAASGEIPGAVKKGKTWLLPRSVLRAQGVLGE